MNIPIINSLLSYLQGDGAVILPEIELLLFGLGILLIDFWITEKEKYLNAGLALAGTLFSGFTLWRLRGAIAARGEFAGFPDSALVDPFFLFFAVLFLAPPAPWVLFSVKSLKIPRRREGKYNALFPLPLIASMLSAPGSTLSVC